MPSILPAKLREYVVDGDPLASVKAMTGAVQAGDIDLSDLKSFVDAVSSGGDIGYQRTKPVSLIMLEQIRANPNDEPRRIIYKGLAEGRWTYEDVERWEENNEVLSNARKTSIPRGVYLTRKRRRLPPARVSDQFVPKLAMDVVCHRGLQDGAKACLAALLSLAGKTDRVITYTSSIAKLLGRTSRTVRNYFIALEECGLIKRRPGKSANTVDILIMPSVRPEPYQEPQDITAYRLARRSSNPALREMAETVAVFAWNVHMAVARVEGGRKQISAFNLISNSKGEMPVNHGQGPTTHSTFQPSFKTDRNRWNSRRHSMHKVDVSGPCPIKQHLLEDKDVDKSYRPKHDVREIPRYPQYKEGPADVEIREACAVG
jgi:hypothetical protein